MEEYILLAYLASAVLAIVIYISKTRRQRELESLNVELRDKHALELTDTKSRLEAQISVLKQEQDNTEEAKLLRYQLTGFREQLAQANEILQKSEVAAKWLADKPDLEAERTAMATAIANLGLDLAEKTRDLVETTQRIQTLAAEAAKTESELGLLTDELDRTRKACEDAKAPLAELNKQNEAAKLQWKQLQDKIQEREQQIKQLDTEIAQRQRTKDEFEADTKRMEEKLKRLEEIRKECEPQALAYEAKAKALENLEDVLTSTRDLQDKIAATNQLMMDDLASIAEARKRGQVVLRQAAFEGLVKSAPFMKPSGNREFKSEANALEQMKHYVRDVRQYDLPDRLLYAFHTSLKTSDISSLTVMAGVSGTGKSALPNLYAKAMGIHLVMLAVEPRWDSPRDLLGFFNYVTNRYEATPLSKALFQFQGHHDTTALTPQHDLKDYMLMALLDEMNLARIEYYFSEFLSKLELRRSGEMDVPEKATEARKVKAQEHRRRVAMEIFAGASGREKKATTNMEVEFIEQPIQLFADYNTLFVGTMNEDETTQSLSDKVLDRANVLYFGRPGNLKPVIAGSEDGEQPMLLRKTWNEWCKSVKKDDTLTTGQWHSPAMLLKELNGQLASLGRPFAHRSYQAMLAYLANYPYVAAGLDMADKAGFFRRPLADQIGMRIMPKLRGLDLAQHAPTLAKVGGIVNLVGDATLTEAFQKATNRQENRSGFFHWQGLDWALGAD